MNKSTSQDYFLRQISATVLKAARSFPVTVLTGPRQSGKTTLLKHLFPNKRYLSLEDPDSLQLVAEDIRGFFATGDSWVIDEAQRLPELFSYLQGFVDEKPRPGRFVLSGSQKFLLSEKISQTLAGRVAIFELLPLMYSEYVTHAHRDAISVWTYLFNGSYPRPYHEGLDIKLWFNSYIRTVLERDVRNVVNIKNLATFQHFLRLCAGRHGQLLNLNALASDAGVSQTTATNWLNILEVSYMVYRLQPYYRNFNKRLVKTPKLYFYDSAIVCRLLGVESPEHLKIHAHRGHIFEGFVITEMLKRYLAQGEPAPVYFWRDHQGVEVDLVIETSAGLDLYEIKSGATFSKDFVKNLTCFERMAKEAIRSKTVIYTGQRREKFATVGILPWEQLVS
jgi:uncharacterized protein